MNVMNTKFLCSLLAVAGMGPSYCSGEAKVKTAAGEGTIKWDKKVEESLVTATIPPGTPAQNLTVHGRTITLPGNPSEYFMTITIHAKDPVILQLPSGWKLKSGEVTTTLGSGNIVIGSGEVPSNATIQNNGVVVLVDKFVAEPGYELHFCDYPAGLAAAGDTSGSITFDIPPSEQRLDRVKFVETWRVQLKDHLGVVHEYFAPIGPDEFDMANVTDFAHTLVVDASAPACVGSTGASPAALASAVDWNLGANTAVQCAGMEPTHPTVLLGGGFELGAPVPVGGVGCALRVNPEVSVMLPVASDGTGALPVSVPNNPALVGATLAWQPVQLDLATSGIVTGNFMKARIEP